MDILTFFTPAEMAGLDGKANVVVVFDVLRGSTTIVAAFKAGAARIIPVVEIDEAIELAQKMSRDDVLLCGERNGETIEGFDMGNSPLEYTPEKVAGKTLIYSSTNCSKAILASRNAKRILIGCFNNIQAIIESVGQTTTIHLLCAGKMGRFSFEDAVCAGMFIHIFLESYSGEIGLNDASSTSRYLYRQHHRNILGVLKQSSHGNFLTKIGHEKDLEYTAWVNSETIVPELSLDKNYIIPTVALQNV